jgi:hypothetical protein
VLAIDIYGSSITLGAGSGIADRYSSLIASAHPEWGIRNAARSASGVMNDLLCGVQRADVIVSEFRMNEADPTLLRQWYNMTASAAQHTVVLDLWSWLMPPRRPEFLNSEVAKSNTTRAAPRSSAFSVLDLAGLISPLWWNQIPPFRAGDMFNESSLFSGHMSRVSRATGIEQETHRMTDSSLHIPGGRCQTRYQSTATPPPESKLQKSVVCYINAGLTCISLMSCSTEGRSITASLRPRWRLTSSGCLHLVPSRRKRPIRPLAEGGLRVTGYAWARGVTSQSTCKRTASA